MTLTIKQNKVGKDAVNMNSCHGAVNIFENGSFLLEFNELIFYHACLSSCMICAKCCFGVRCKMCKILTLHVYG